MERWEKSFVVLVLLMIIMFSGLLWYQSNRDDQLQKDQTEQGRLLSDRLDQLERSQHEAQARLSSLIESEIVGVRKDLDSAKSGLTSKIQLVGKSVEGVKQETEESQKVLTGQLRTIQVQSEQKLGAIEQQLLNVNVKSENFAGIVQKVIQSVVAINTDAGIGSGAIVDEAGYVVTNRHVVEGATQGSAKTTDGAHHQVRVVKKSDTSDLALLQIQGSYPFLTFGNSEKVAVGSRVVAMGSPAGLEFTVSEGIVSAKRRIGDFDYIQTDLSLNPGNSGGPLINARGELIGINTIKLKGFEGLGFALSSEEVRDFVLPAILDDKKAQQSGEKSQG